MKASCTRERNAIHPTLSEVSVAHGQPWSGSAKGKISEVNNATFEDPQPLSLAAPDTQPSTWSWPDDPSSLEADDPPFDVRLKGQKQRKATSQCIGHSPRSNVSHRYFIISHLHKKKGHFSIIRYFEKETTFI